jgi:hypothetical protein
VSRYVKLAKYAEMHEHDPRTVMRMLKQNRIEGARKVLVGGTLIWAIPEDAPWPVSLKLSPDDDINDFIE